MRRTCIITNEVTTKLDILQKYYTFCIKEVIVITVFRAYKTFTVRGCQPRVGE